MSVLTGKLNQCYKLRFKPGKRKKSFTIFNFKNSEQFFFYLKISLKVEFKMILSKVRFFLSVQNIKLVSTKNFDQVNKLSLLLGSSVLLPTRLFCMKLQISGLAFFPLIYGPLNDLQSFIIF